MAIGVCQGIRFRAALSITVLLEARWNIAEKFGEIELVRFYQQIAAMSPEMAPPLTDEEMARYIPLTGERDAHVLAAALACGASYLLTLDRRHLLTSAIESAGLPLKVMTPGDFLQQVATLGA